MSLILHKGGTLVPFEQVLSVPVPPPEGAWRAVPHAEVYREFENQLGLADLRVTNAQHALACEGQRYFSLLDVQSAQAPEGVGFVVAIRNSHDKTFSIQGTAGHRVFVCDNLAFNGTVRFTRKHTAHALADLPLRVSNMVGQLARLFTDQSARVEAYRACEISSDALAHDLIVRLLLAGAICNRDVVHVVNEWRKPSHEEFAPRNLWSLSNAVTEVHKRVGDPAALFQRGHAMTSILDGAAGLMFEEPAALSS